MKILRWDDAEMEFEEGDTECLGQFQLREKVNSHKKFKGKLKKFLKTNFEMQNTGFRDWNKSPVSR